MMNLYSLIAILICLTIIGIYLLVRKKNSSSKLYDIEENKKIELIYLPSPKNINPLTDTLRLTVEKTIAKYSIDKRLPRYKYGSPYAHVYIFTDEISQGTSIDKAHQVWLLAGLKKVSTPFNLMRQSEDSTTPNSLIKVEIQNVIRTNRSYWGYDGYFLSLLVDKNSECIWDARGGITAVL